eukprot:g452.t1
MGARRAALHVRGLTALTSCHADSFVTDAYLRKIGNTPTAALRDAPGLYAKLEGHNPGHSIKDRTITSIVTNMLADGALGGPTGANTLVLVTSGSAGVSLVELHKALTVDVNVIIVMPSAYAVKESPAQVIETCSMDEPGEVPAGVWHSFDDVVEHEASSCQVVLVDGVFVDVLAQTREVAARKGWCVLEQHTDATSMLGHESTAREILRDTPAVTDVVCATGTGATAAGLREFLPDHVTVHSRMAKSGEIDGLSDVRRYSNFCDTTVLEGYSACHFDKGAAAAHTQALADYGILAGPSSGACFWLAREVLASRPDGEGEVVFICADGTLADGAAISPRLQVL